MDETRLSDWRSSRSAVRALFDSGGNRRVFLPPHGYSVEDFIALLPPLRYSLQICGLWSVALWFFIKGEGL